MEVKVKLQRNGKDAHQQICECGSPGFIVWKVDTERVAHYTCIDCSATYCGTWDGTHCTEHPAKH